MPTPTSTTNYRSITDPSPPNHNNNNSRSRNGNTRPSSSSTARGTRSHRSPSGSLPTASTSPEASTSRRPSSSRASPTSQNSTSTGTSTSNTSRRSGPSAITASSKEVSAATGPSESSNHRPQRSARSGRTPAATTRVTTTTRQTTNAPTSSRTEASLPLVIRHVSPELVEYMPHRGFATSIHDMFAQPRYERVDCCAMTCCGVLQSDRDRFLLTGIPPPTPLKRCTVHIGMPLLIFLLAGYGALHIEQPQINQLVSTALVCLLVGYFCLQCYKGRSKRIEIRKDLLYVKYQLQNNHLHHHTLAVLLEQERPEEDRPEFYLGQSERDFSCAHPCCWLGCYPEDRSMNEVLPTWWTGDEETLDEATAHRRRDDNMCARLWAGACGSCCGCHLQTCGICALGQEGREIEAVLLPPAYRRIDYITMQPMMEYYPAIYQNKWQRRSSWPHLSRLSINLLQTWLLVSLLLCGWSWVSPLYWSRIANAHVHHPATFGWPDYWVYLATWAQAMGLLTLLAFLTNRPLNSQLSVDAMIKFFAAGFCLSTTLAFFWELVLGLTLHLGLAVLLDMAGVDTQDSPSTNGGGDGSSSNSTTSTWGVRLMADPWWRMTEASGGGMSTKDYLEAYGLHHPLFYTVYLLVTSFILAAFVEELCKYFGFRMAMEHPDFFSKRDLDEAALIVYHHRDEEEDEEAQEQRVAQQERQDFSSQRTSAQEQGAAITLAMLCVAMGFTCCENLVYIFVYSGSSVQMELAVLIARSFFPIHPIAAAIQSIGVVQRDLEGSRVHKLGVVVWPAIFFHGSYDFFILWIDYLGKRRGQPAETSVLGGDSLTSILSLVTSVTLMFTALYLYTRAAHRQRERLANMDRQAAVDRSRLL